MLLLAVFGFAIVLISTKQGVGRISDSLAYVAASQNLVNHGVLSTARPFTRWPPMYPALIALPGLFGIDPWTAIRYLNAFFFGCDIFLIGLMVSRCASIAGASLFGGLLFATSIDLLGLHSFALSEPPFLFFVLAVFLLLDKYLEKSSLPFLLMTAFVVSLACLTRYVGVTVVAASVIAICFFSKKPGLKKWKDIFLFGFLSCIPVTLWVAHGLSAANRVGGRKLTYHPIGRDQLASVSEVVSQWINPIRPDQITWNILICACLIAIGLAFAAWLLSRHSILVSNRSLIPQMLAIFIVGYVLFLAISISFFDAETTFSSRHLALVHGCLIILGLWLLDRMTRNLPSKRVVYMMGFLLVLLCAEMSATAMGWVSEKGGEGHGYYAKKWADSPLIQEIKKLGPETFIYTNFPLGISLHIHDRKLMPLPSKIQEQTRETNPRYESELRLLVGRLQHCKAVVVWFNDIQKPLWISEGELLQRIPLKKMIANEDGSFYRDSVCFQNP